MTTKSTTHDRKKASDSYNEIDLTSGEFSDGYWIRRPAGARTTSRQDYELARVFDDGVIEFGYRRDDGTAKLVEWSDEPAGTEVVPRRAEYTVERAPEPTIDGGTNWYKTVRCEECGAETAPANATEVRHDSDCPDAREVSD